MATGGIGGLYEHSTNFPILTGDACRIAEQHGVELEHMDYVQIHPTFGLLRKSYRNTVEISEYANEILRHGDFSIYPVEPIIRHGANVCVEPVQGESALFGRTAETIRDWQRKGYETIAVICRDEEEAGRVAARLAEDVPVKNGAKGEAEVRR